ncbi:hypothetical protein H9Q72_009624 [Fusarium xylarioides]|uniref:Uncharacterized protein n=1 Tax=Fusarium xylarioides TaxID=221167 RepID=A0A9P7HRF8_9HYPO|nr:hypothetical protein H9Q70_011916 [Fusarium xylarioides]KAG5762284.1 hypothetical protein H9Q72_009624 [Fusarium xylarioides]KAG5774852.1 hypothetical protein H9Q73_011480 [Fusarium xylarioides]
MQPDSCNVPKTISDTPAARGIFVCASEDTPGHPSPAISKDQIVTRLETPDIFGYVKACSSSPKTDISHPRTKQVQSKDELSAGDLKVVGKSNGMTEWIASIKEAGSAPSPSLSTHSPSSGSSSLKTTPRGFVPGESLMKSRALIMELFQAVFNHDSESSSDELGSAVESPVQSANSSTPLTDGSGTDNPPKSSTTTSVGSFERGSKRSHPTVSGLSQEGDGDEDEPSRKESRQEKNPSRSEAVASFQSRLQMPCPVNQPQKCQGTNATISELLRSLEVRHRTVICKDCCTKFDVPEDERKPENVRKRHKSVTCEPRCIGTACFGITNDDIPHHPRTENCPTWQSLPTETRWSFIWALVNPGKNLPEPSFYTGVGFEHNTSRRQCKQQSRARGADICDALMRDIEERDKKSISLEAELKEANEEIQSNAQLEEKQKKRIGSLENIIETLLERLEENNVKVPNSVQKRLQEECPGAFCEPVARLMSKHSQALPTPSSLLKDGTGEPENSQLNQSTTAILQPPLFSSAGTGDGNSPPFDFDLDEELFTNFIYTDEALVDSSQQLPGGVA